MTTTKTTIWTEKRNTYREPCADCLKPLGNFLLWFRDEKPLCDLCERKSGRVPRKSEAECDASWEDVQGIS